MPSHSSDASAAAGKQSTEFPDAHKTRLKSLIPEYEAFIKEKNPDLRSRCNDLTKWRKDTAKKLMKEDMFKNLIGTTQVEAADWEEAVRRFFTNHYNNTYLAKIRRAATKHATTSFPSTASHTSPTVPTEPPPKALQEILRRATVIFSGDLSAREMFASENNEAIQRKIEDIRTENPELDLAGGGMRNKALKELWATADKDLWQSKIETLARDIDANRAQFPSLMLQALQDLCSRERLGSTLMSFTWAFRDVKTDGIKGGQIFAGYDAYKEEPVTNNVQPSGHKAQLEAWLNHADAVLSRKPRSCVYQIPLNKDGIPILPQIDTSEATASQLSQLLDEYLLSLWKFAGWATTENSLAIPWDDIVKHPHHYFDTLLYKLPCPLNAPDVLKSTPHHIFSLHEFFLLSNSALLPFQFRSKQDSEIMKDSETSLLIGNELDDGDSESPLDSASSPMSPLTVTLSTLHRDCSPPSLSHCSSPSDNSPVESETPPSLPPSTANPKPASGLNPSIANPSSIIAHSECESVPKTIATSLETSPSEGVTKGTSKKRMRRTNKQPESGKGARGWRLKKIAKAVEETQPRNTINSPQAEPRPSTRKSGRAADLKRKQADTSREVEPFSGQSEPAKKKKRLQDRWFYEPVIPVINPASQP